MARDGMTERAARGIFWKLMENGGAQGIQFIVAVLLARLLTPAEYGTVGLILIFITIANVFVQSGFSTALIQKKDADGLDFSSVCWFELGMAAVFYGLLYLAAPLIADFYGIGILCAVVRALAFVLFPGAVISVQTAWLSRRLEFRGLFAATFAASVVSGVLSVLLALRGLGVWAMAAQQLLYYLCLMCALFAASGFRPGFSFSAARVRGMFSFGWKLLLASLLDTVFNNMYGLLIGKIYSEELLGSYSRGEQFPKLIAANLGTAVQAVLLPVFSSYQDDRAAVRQMVRRALRLSSFLVCPMLLGLFAVADNLVYALLGPQWLICVPFLRLLSISYCFWPIHITNLQAVNALGRSDIFLKVEIVKKVLGVAALLIGMRFSVLTLVAVKVFQDFLCTFVNAAPNGRLLGYGPLAQWLDVLPNLLLSAMMAAAVRALGGLLAGIGAFPALFAQVLFGAAFYLAAAALLRMESFQYLYSLTVRLVKKK